MDWIYDVLHPSCTDVDKCIDQVCALHDNSMNPNPGILRRHSPFTDVRRHDSNIHVTFSDDAPEELEVVPYSEIYGTHPRFILAGPTDWKRNPARSYPYTGKSSAIMTQRKKAARKTIRSKVSRQNRRSILNTANQQGIGTARRQRSHGPSSPQDDSSHTFMDMEINSTPTITSMDVDTDMDADINMLNMLKRVFTMGMSRKVFANRTKPIKKHGQKRVGAKKAKKLEISENGSFELSPSHATAYRALAARCNYLAQDRPDIAYSSKKLCREFSVPTQASFKKLKRLCRYLAGMPRLQYVYKWQDMPAELTVFVDTDFAGCNETRRSTSGGAAMIGQRVVKH